VATTFFRYRDPSGGWVLTDRIEAVPKWARAEAERIESSELPALVAPAPADLDPALDGPPARVRDQLRRRREAATRDDDPAARGEGPPGGASLEGGFAQWVQSARELGPGPAATAVDFDVPSFGIGLGLGLAAFVVYAWVRRSGRLVVRLATLALVLGLMGASFAALWWGPLVPGAPDWLKTPDQLIREARRVAEDVAPEERLGDLK